MQQAIKEKKFRRLTAEYFETKAKQAKGPEKLLVMLEMNNYVRDARKHGLSFEELKELGFRFATV